MLRPDCGRFSISGASHCCPRKKDNVTMATQIASEATAPMIAAVLRDRTTQIPAIPEPHQRRDCDADCDSHALAVRAVGRCGSSWS